MLIGFICSFLCSQANATTVKYSPKGISDQERVWAHALMTEVNAQLPESLKAAVIDEIIVYFEILSDGPVPPPRCGSSKVNSTVDHFGMLAGFKVNKNSGKGKIIVNRHVLVDYGQRAGVRFNCGHKNLRQRAVAAVVHEYLHAYDYFAGISKSKHERETSQLVRKISDDVVFRGKSLWRPTEYSHRSPDPYEKANIKEFAAVNFEFFLLDETYKCRRPHMYDYYSRHFGVSPHRGHRCQSLSKVVLFRNNQPSLESLDPTRVYEIQYLLASPGEGVTSGFGHSMIRLVVCAPETEFGPECRADFSHHIVASFRANVDDMVINNFRGLIGGYHSILYAFPLNAVIDEYAMKEMRNLYGYPIKFSRNQINQFVQNFLAIHWGYEGDYKFLTANCATETWDLLVSIFNQPSLFTNRSITPVAVRESLIRVGLIDPKHRNQLPITSILKSREEPLSKAYDRLFGTTGADRDTLVRYFDLSPWQRRSDFNARFSQLVGRTGKSREDYLDVLSFSALEAQALKYHIQETQKDLAKRVHQYAERNKGRVSQRIKSYVQEVTLTQQAFVNGGYGLPQGREIPAIESTFAERAQKEINIEQVLRELGINIDPQIREIEAIQENLDASRALSKQLRP